MRVTRFYESSRPLDQGPRPLQCVMARVPPRPSSLYIQSIFGHPKMETKIRYPALDLNIQYTSF